jgi:hypothetical protein
LAAHDIQPFTSQRIDRHLIEAGVRRRQDGGTDSEGSSPSGVLLRFGLQYDAITAQTPQIRRFARLPFSAVLLNRGL